MPKQYKFEDGFTIDTVLATDDKGTITFGDCVKLMAQHQALTERVLYLEAVIAEQEEYE